MSIGHFRIGNRILVFQHLSLSMTKVLLAVMTEQSWLKIWGLPLSAWSKVIFAKIGRRCRGY